jgi:hypothetical protein
MSNLLEMLKAFPFTACFVVLLPNHQNEVLDLPPGTKFPLDTHRSSLSALNQREFHIQKQSIGSAVATCSNMHATHLVGKINFARHATVCPDVRMELI